MSTKIAMTLAAHTILAGLAACAGSTEENGNIVHYENDADTDILLTNEFALRNEEMVDANNHPAFMASKSGVAYIEANPEFFEAPVAVEIPAASEGENVVKGFVIQDNVKLPSTRTRSSKYPFGQLQVGQGFSIPVGWKGVNGEEEPNNEPWKTMQSAVSAANRQYKDEEGVATRKFKQARVVLDETSGLEGSMITRVEVEPREVQLQKIADRRAKAAAAKKAKEAPAA